jgi:hypothetical protein
MLMLSDDDLNIRGMTDEELEAAWDLWFDVAQETNDFDPPYTHGVLASPWFPAERRAGRGRPPGMTGE